MREKAVYGALSAEPGRGSDVDANSPGRKIGDSGLCHDFQGLLKTSAALGTPSTA